MSDDATALQDKASLQKAHVNSLKGESISQNSAEATNAFGSEFAGARNVDALAVPVSESSSQVRTLSLNISRDEMNLAEFPLTVLSKRSDPSVKTLEFSDVVKGKNGDTINRKWIITGADKFGLPTSSDDEVLLGLLKLTADDGLKSRKIHFTRYELLKILRWTTEGRSYTRLQNALDRLSGVRIKATNAFYDNESKLHSTRNFGIIDAYEINDGRDTQPSFFTWSEVLFKSFQVGFIKKLDLEFYLDLQSAVSKRLYRYLDKHFWYRSRIQVNLFILAHEKIGVSRNYVYASSLRQQLEPALDELKEKGMLSSYEFLGKGKSTEVVLNAAMAPKRTLTQASSGDGTQGTSNGSGRALESNNLYDNRLHHKRPGQVESDSGSVAAEHPEGFRRVAAALVKRGIVERQAVKLVEGQGAEVLQRIECIIQHFDKLVASSSHLVSRNPTGFLYRAVERPLEFSLPTDKQSSQGRGKTNRSHQTGLSFEGAKQSSGAHPHVARASNTSQADLEIVYLAERSNVLERARASVSSNVHTSLCNEVESSLAKLRAHLSSQRFEEAVRRGVDQKLLDMAKFPDLAEWTKMRKNQF
jgi:hypothetical protein